MLEIRILGRTRLRRDGQEVDLGPASRRAVFGLLVLAGGHPLTRHELVDALWRDEIPFSATNVLQTHVKHLRRVLEPQRPSRVRSDLLQTVGDGYALRLGEAEIDLDEFRRLTRCAADAAGAGEVDRVAALLSEALGWWRGQPLADVPLLAEHPKITCLLAERRQAVASYAEAMVALGRTAEVLTLLAEDAAANPFDESAQARLLRAYRAAGQRARALEVYESARRLLADELGVDPGAELAAAHLDLLREKPPAAARAVRQLPADVPGFTGRDSELAELDRCLENRSAMAICGTAGVGKTALALRWAHRVAARFPDGQLYLDLRGYDPEQTVSASEALARILDTLGLAPSAVPLGIDERSSRYRAELAGKEMLIVLDNASSVDQVRPLIPGTCNSLLLITSRDSLAGLVALHGVHRVVLDLLPEQDAVCLLRQLIGARVEAEPRRAIQLAQQCARLPLALRVAAELAVATPSMSVADLVSELADRQRRLDVLDPGGDIRAAVRNVFSWSVQHLSAEAAMVFRRLGLHPGPQFDAGAVAALADVDLARAARLLDVLVRAHLVRPLGHRRFALHDLLRAYAAELTATLDLYPTRESAVDRLLDHYLARAHAATLTLYPAWRGYRHGKPAEEVSFSESGARGWLDAELPNFAALGAFAAVNGRPGHAIGLATNLHRHLESGHHLDAMTIQSHALAAARDAGDCRAQAHLLTNLGDLHRLLGHYSPAIEHHTQALALHRKTGDRRGQARTLSDLGIVRERRGDYEPAAGHHREALAIYRELGDSLGEAGVLVNLGNVDTELDRNLEAAVGFQRAFELFQQLGDRAGQAIAMASLGDALTRLGRYPEAEKRLEEALHLFRDIGHRYGEATALNNLATMALRLGSLAEAAASFRAALEIFRETGHRYGEAHSLNGLGEASHAGGDRAAALALHTEALAIATETGDLDEQIRAKSGLGVATTE